MRNRYLKYFLISLVLIGIDFIPKIIISIHNLIPNYLNYLSVKSSFFEIEIFENYNMMFHAFSSFRQPFKNIVIYGIFISTIFISLLMLRKTIRLRFSYILPWLLILSGTFSNLIDKIKNGYIIDYLNLTFYNFFSIYFNFADVYVFLGIALLFIQHIVIIYKKQ